jgi:hypothetical protein
MRRVTAKTPSKIAARLSGFSFALSMRVSDKGACIMLTDKKPRSFSTIHKLILPPPSGDMQSRLRSKLHPGRFSAMSNKMAAIVGYIIGEQFIDPPIWKMTVTSDGFVLARVGDQVGFDTFISSYLPLLRNWSRLIAAADLTPEEQVEAACRFAARVGFYGRATA